MSTGWISLHRKLIDWCWYHDSETVHLFIHCLLSANQKPAKWMGIDIKRGQFVTSINMLKAATGITTKKIRNRLVKLEKTGEMASIWTSKYQFEHR
jgi:hypothetical protein